MLKRVGSTGKVGFESPLWAARQTVNGSEDNGMVAAQDGVKTRDTIRERYRNGKVSGRCMGLKSPGDPKTWPRLRFIGTHPSLVNSFCQSETGVVG